VTEHDDLDDMGANGGAAARGGRVAVLGCAPTLLVSVEHGPDGSEVQEIHLHPGGQGFWAARMAALLGARVTLVAPLGGESGVALKALIEDAGVAVVAVDSGAPNAVLVSSDHEGEDASIASSEPVAMSRHDLDGLVSAFIAASLEADVTVLTGCGKDPLMDEGRFHNLAHDLRAVGRRVVADLSGDSLHAALKGGLDVIKVSDEEIVGSGLAASDDEADLIEGMFRLRERGATTVLVSRAERPLLALDGDTILQVSSPSFRPVNHRGAGDSLTGAISAGLAAGQGLHEALSRAVAAGALNVTRHGLGTGDAQVIEALAGKVEVLTSRAAPPPDAE
jgi:1-phosphofructokinase